MLLGQVRPSRASLRVERISRLRLSWNFETQLIGTSREHEVVQVLGLAAPTKTADTVVLDGWHAARDDP